MKTWILALALAAPGAALAQTVEGAATQRLEIIGEASPACRLDAARLTSATGAVFQASGDRTGTIDLTQLVDPQTAVARPASVSLGLPLVCNGAHVLTVRTQGGGLRPSEPVVAADGFRAVLPYELSVDWAGQRNTGSSESILELRTDNAQAGEVSFAVNVPEGGLPLVSGTYGDSIVIELLPVH